MSLFGGSEPTLDEAAARNGAPTIRSPSASQNSIVEVAHDPPLPVLGVPGQGLDAPSDADRESDDNSWEEDDDEDDIRGQYQAPRPNKYHGTSQKWNRWVSDERALSKSLDQEQAGNLSIHLYNTHAFKERLRSAEIGKSVKEWDSKRRWVNNLQKDNWVPPPLWTAWPLKPHLVPRPDEVFNAPPLDGLDSLEDQQTDPWKPSKDLEEELLALILKRAKERWNQRVSYDGIDEERSRKRNRRDGPRFETSRSRSRASQSQSFAVNSKSRPSSRNSTERSSYQSGDGASSAEGQPSNDNTTTITESRNRGKNAVFLADDDKARQLLLPNVRSMLDRVEKLLATLEATRRNHYHEHSDATDSEAPTEAEKESISGESTRSVASYKNKSNRGARSNKAGSKRRSKSERRSRGSSSDAMEEDTTANELFSDTSDHESEGGRRRRSSSLSATRGLAWRRRPELMDWSEVLGTASLVGFPPDAVERATRRCASLFNEGMKVRSFHGIHSQEVRYEPSIIPSLQTEPLDSESFSDTQSEPESRQYLRPWPPKSLECPHQGCKWNEVEFSKPGRLLQHLRGTHRYDPRFEEPLEATDELLDSIHVDGFLQPIRVQAGWRGKSKIGGIESKEPLQSDIDSQ